MWFLQFYRFFLNLENENRFELLTKEKKIRQQLSDTAKNTFVSGLKFVRINKGKTSVMGIP